ncbi:MAG: MBL fold metallo-hydrolase [Chloracidobacterium sp. CP2_5A]|nr:MAG: MBL fold metallo-hydrolase [Chloracidobacterium sp. CP2_5A]
MRLIMTTATPKYASAVILLRRDPTGVWRFFWAKRAEATPFLGGYHAFLGGRRDPEDNHIPVRHATDAEHAAQCVCAAREVFEEAGVVLADGRLTDAETRLAARADLMAGRVTFAEICARFDLRIDARRFTPAGRWVTPAGVPRRYDTTFFISELDFQQEPRLWPEEMVDGNWMTPSEALDAWARGAIRLVPPTLHSVRSLLRWTAEGAARRADFERLSALFHDHPAARGEPPAFIELAPGIVTFPLRTPTLPPATHTNCYLVGDRDLIVIDPASPYPDEQTRLDAHLTQLADQSGARVREIWLTHHHPDHVGGVATLSRRWNAPVAAHPITAKLLDGQIPVARLLNDGDACELSAAALVAQGLVPATWPGWRLRAVFTPGHARGHLCFFEETTGTLFSGDMVVGLGSVLVDPDEGDMADYLDSLQRLLGLPMRAIAGGHGPALTAPRAVIESYIAHRRQREARIVAALRDGASTVPDLVATVYADTPPALHPLAARSVQAHLVKLMREGKARRRSDGRLELTDVA